VGGEGESNRWEIWLLEIGGSDGRGLLVVFGGFSYVLGFSFLDNGIEKGWGGECLLVWLSS
jgi:hypothetical protein